MKKIIILLIVVLSFAGCSLFKENIDFKYEVTGTHEAIWITCLAEDGKEVSLIISPPWEYEAEAPRGTYLKITASSEICNDPITISISYKNIYETNYRSAVVATNNNTVSLWGLMY
jgi:hypothetical protein